MARGKSLALSRVKLNGMGKIAHLYCMAKSGIFKRNDRQLHMLVMYAGGADYTESTVQRTLCELPEALETAMLCYSEVFIRSKLEKY